MLIDFKSGFNVITGETGAGKSLIIKSLSLLSGTQASESVIHPDEDVAFIEATFQVPVTVKISKEYLDHDRLTVSRRIHRGRPTINKINFESVSLKELKYVMSQVMCLTAQHQVMELMEDANHMHMFDQFIGQNMTVLKASYQLAYKDYQSLKKRAEDVLEKNEVVSNEMNELRVLISDIDDQNFSVEEEDDLLIQQKKCNALNDRRQLVGKVLSFSSDVMDQVNEMDRALTDLNELIPKKVTYDALNVLEDLNQLHQSMANERMEIEYLESIDVDEINARLKHIFQYKVKYRVNALSELLALRDHAKEKLKTIDDYMNDKQDASKAMAVQYKKVLDLAIQISESRKKEAAGFEYVVLNQIKQLGMVDARFKLEIQTLDDVTSFGQDAISFMFSANPNMPLQPLKKVASGGELSRVMLALLVSHRGGINQPMVVFDEIDVGIGGITANYIGTTLQKMSEHLQLLVVTHLPQIARCAQHHYKITKTIENNESCVSIQPLSKDDVSIELQRMVGGDVVSSLIK